MDMDTENTNEIITKTTSQDAQDRSAEPLSLTQILIEQAPNLNNNEQQQQPKKKKKSRGNRKLQRFKTKCRSKGMNNQAIELLTKIQKANRLIHQDNQPIHEEQLNDSSIMNSESEVKDSISFENQDGTNQHRDIKENVIDHLTIQSSSLQQSIATDERISISPRNYENKIEHHNLSNDDWKQSSKFIPTYQNLSLSSFKDLLTKTIPMHYHRQMIEQWLTTNTAMVLYLQRRAELMSPIIQLNITQHYWNHSVKLNENAMIRFSKLSKDILKKENVINQYYSKKNIIIQDQQNIIQNKLQLAQHHLNLHSKQPCLLNWQKENKTSVNNLMNKISSALNTLIQNDLFYFLNYIHQVMILENFYSCDSFQLKLFYGLIPTEEQIRSAKQIWRTKFQSCQLTIPHPKQDHSLNMNQITTEEGINQELQRQLTSIKGFAPSMRNMIEARLVNIEKLAQQLKKFNNSIHDTIFI